MVVHDQVKFSDPIEFNDPFEFQVNVVPPSDLDGYIEYVGKKYGRSEAEVRQRVADPNTFVEARQWIFDGARERFTVFSASATFHDPAMWGYYADEHRGIAVELCNDVYFQDPSPVHYPKDNSYPSIPLDELTSDESFEKALSTKSNSWRHEEEWRYLNCHDSPPPDRDIVQLPSDMITGVIVGARAGAAIERVVARWLHLRDRPASLWRAIVAPGDYAVQRELIRNF